MSHRNLRLQVSGVQHKLSLLLFQSKSTRTLQRCLSSLPGMIHQNSLNNSANLRLVARTISSYLWEVDRTTTLLNLSDKPLYLENGFVWKTYISLLPGCQPWKRNSSCWKINMKTSESSLPAKNTPISPIFCCKPVSKCRISLRLD